MLNRRSFVKTSALAPAAYALQRALGAAEPTDRSLVLPNAAQQAWHDMELGMFFHFDIPIYKQGWNWRTYKDFPEPNLYQPPCQEHNVNPLFPFPDRLRSVFSAG
jgi:hypothetical protein